MTIPAGTRLGRYDIRTPLGVGGMGEVYLAEDTVMRRLVAIKLLTADFTQNEEKLRRFEREAYAASTLNHPNIVTIYEIAVEGDSHFIATEFVDGESLRQYLLLNEVELREVVEMAIQITSALAAAHEAGIIHRDIKPENIMRRRDGYLKILDFGLAKLSDDGRSDAGTEAATQVIIKTDPGRVMGTVNYMSPEQARGHAVDPRTDIFSLGVVLYEMVIGSRPFAGDTKSDVLAAVLMIEPEPLASKLPGVPAELNRIVSKTLRKNREERYQTAKELLLDLKSLRQELEFEARLGKPVLRVGGVDSQTDAFVRKPTTVRQSDAIPTISELFINEVKVHPRRSGITLSIIGLVIALTAFGLYRLIRSVQGPEPFQAMKIVKITSAGNVVDGQSAIAPDGKFVAYAVNEEGQQSLWVRQVATSGNVQIVPPNSVAYNGLTVSPDGDYVYFIAIETGISSLFRVAAFGGPPRKLIEDAQGPVSFSPDGHRLAFLRNERTLILANADGTSPQTLATAGDGERWSRPAWSPNGQTIACGALPPKDATIHLIGVALKNGKTETIASPPWILLGGLVWVPDGTELLVTARSLDTRLAQIWSVTYPSGKLRRVTNDLSRYDGLSITADGKSMLSVQAERVSNIWVVPQVDTSLARRLTTETGKDEGLEGLAWTPDGRIIYSARNTGAWDLWIINQDGTGNRQLTFNEQANFPSVTPDGRYVVFVSTRSGGANIWRMDIDGTNLKQLTNGTGSAGQPHCSADGQWVVYQINDKESNIWKVPIDGGEAIQLTRNPAERPSFSADGKSILCKDERTARMIVLPADGGPDARLFDLPSVAQSSFFRWAADGRSIVYISSRDRVYNLSIQSLDGAPPKQITSFGSERIFKFDLSRDGRLLALARGHLGSDVILFNDYR